VQSFSQDSLPILNKLIQSRVFDCKLEWSVLKKERNTLFLFWILTIYCPVNRLCLIWHQGIKYNLFQTKSV